MRIGRNVFLSSRIVCAVALCALVQASACGTEAARAMTMMTFREDWYVITSCISGCHHQQSQHRTYDIAIDDHQFRVIDRATGLKVYGDTRTGKMVTVSADGSKLHESLPKFNEDDPAILRAILPGDAGVNVISRSSLKSAPGLIGAHYEMYVTPESAPFLYPISGSLHYSANVYQRKSISFCPPVLRRAPLTPKATDCLTQPPSSRPLIVHMTLWTISPDRRLKSEVILTRSNIHISTLNPDVFVAPH